MKNFTDEEIKKLNTKRLLSIFKVIRYNSVDLDLCNRLKKELNLREHIERN